MKSIAYHVRETLVYAYLIGFYERFRYGDGFGRSHDTNESWNEAYDSGANLSDRLTGNHP